MRSPAAFSTTPRSSSSTNRRSASIPRPAITSGTHRCARQGERDHDYPHHALHGGSGPVVNRVAIIDHGRIIAIDTPENLKDGLGGDLVTIRSPEPAAAAEALKEPWVVRVETHNDEVTVSLKNADQFVSTIVTLLNKRQVPITSIAIHKPTLEDVFLSFTGKTIREQEADHKETMRTYQRMMRH